MGLGLSKVFSGVFGKTEVRTALVGLDCVGKTTILYKLKLGKIVSTIPTIVQNVEIVEYNNISFNIIDFTGQHRYKIRPLWRHFFYNTQALIYVVDSTDPDRVDEARDELHEMLNQDELRNAMVLVYANKQDRPNAMNVDEIYNRESLSTSLVRFIYTEPYKIWPYFDASVALCNRHIESTSAITREGLYEGLNWLSNITLNKHVGSSSD